MAYTDSEDLNYIGTLFETAARETPFLNSLGGALSPDGTLNLNRVRTVSSFEFDCAVPYDSGAGTQPAITEAASVTGVTANTITRGQDNNTCQIFQRKAEVSYKKLSTTGTISTGLLGGGNIDGVTPGLNFNMSGNSVMDELNFQVGVNMKGMASDINYSFLRGTYQAAASALTAAKTRGIITAVTTNAVAAGGANLSTTHVNAVIKLMVDSGAPRRNVVAIANSYQCQQLGSLYEHVPMDRNVGGSAITRIMTPFCTFDILYDPSMPTDTILFAEYSVIKITICPVLGQLIIIELKPTDGASVAKQMYLQAGIDYGPEEYHGKITGL